jgi:hypothetical protein
MGDPGNSLNVGLGAILVGMRSTNEIHRDIGSDTDQLLKLIVTDASATPINAFVVTNAWKLIND